MSNLYTTLTAVKANLDKTDTADDAILMRIIEAVSREIDNYCDRHFYVWTGARRFDSMEGGTLLIPDLLSVSAFATDTEQDGSFDDETWVESTDYFLIPYNAFPKTQVNVSSFGSYSFSTLGRGVQITGNWGFGDGKSATPYVRATETITVASSSATTGTLSAATDVKAGHTLLLGSEQVYVSAISSNTVTIERGINGTTAAAHSAGTAVDIYEYPYDVSNICAYRAASLFEQRSGLDLQSEKIGDWSATYARESGGISDKVFDRVLSPYRRLAVV